MRGFDLMAVSFTRGGILSSATGESGLPLSDTVGQLFRLPRLYVESEKFLDSDHRPRNTQRLSGWRPRGISLDDDVMDVRANVVDVLASWCGMVVEEHQVTGPDKRTVELLASFLRAHLPWLRTHPAAADFADEIAGLVRAVRAVVYSEPEIQVGLGRCRYPGCDRVMTATIGTSGVATSAASTPHSVRCDAGHAWLPHQWLLLGTPAEQARHRDGREPRDPDPGAPA